MTDELEPQAKEQGADELSRLIIALMRGVIYREREPHAWAGLDRLHTQIRNYVSVVRLDLHVDHTDGFAYLRSRSGEQEPEDGFPRLIPRRPLTFEDSLLLVLLRRQLAEFDVSSTETRMIVAGADMVQMMREFLAHTNDDAPILRTVHASIARLVRMGFLREMASPAEPGTYELQRILKAFVNAQWMENMEENLATYRRQALGQQVEGGDGE